MLESITQKFTDITKQLSGKSKITEKNIEDVVSEIKVALLDADVNLRVVRRFVNSTIEEAKGEKVLKALNPGQQFVKIVYDKMVSLLGDTNQGLDLLSTNKVSTILMLGLQGAGKTTASAKLANKLKNENRRPLLVAADLVRPAAIEQLKVLGAQINVPVYTEDTKDALKLVNNAISYGKKNQFDTIIIDTAGRLQIDEKMMGELVSIKEAINPQECLFVADAMTGQNAVEIAKSFDEQVGITGVILTKFDSDTRGGAALSLKSSIGKPIKFIGIGEKIEDIEPFYPERVASRILGMGDVVSLVEKVQETVSQDEALEMQKKMMNSTFTLEDYLDQFQKLKKMGSMQSIISMIPGMAGKIGDSDIDEKGIKREEAIILSMTIQERRNYRLIGPPRRKRIAIGSGTSVADVAKLLKKFEKTKLMMKKVTKNKKYQNQLMEQFGGMM
jgi:signal recognition particle subunit SRP54